MKRESENQLYNKQHGGHESVNSERRRVLRKMLLSVFTPQSRAVRGNVTSINAESSKHVFTKVALSHDI